MDNNKNTENAPLTVYVVEVLIDIRNTPGFVTVETVGVFRHRTPAEKARLEKTVEIVKEFLDPDTLEDEVEDWGDIDELEMMLEDADVDDLCYRNYDLSSLPMVRVREVEVK
jgi:hypothetical protein